MAEELMRISGIGKIAADRLLAAGITTITQVAEAKPEELAFVKGIGMVTAQKIIDNAKHLSTLERGLTIVLDMVKRNFLKSCPKCGGEMKKKFIILGPERRIAANQCQLCNFYLPT
jgi:predicted RecB family nuclease